MIPIAKMLMIVPLMIWSARTVIDSQAWTAETAHAARDGGEQTDQQREA